MLIQPTATLGSGAMGDFCRVSLRLRVEAQVDWYEAPVEI